MPADRISPRSSLLETMRALAQSKAGSPAAASSPPPVTSTKTDQAATPQHDTAVLRQRLQTLLAGVNPDDDQATGAIREPVLREIILWEFGSDFRQSMHFQPMIERINQSIDIDEHFQAQFVAMIRGLKR